ncbi:glycine/D-amino acid oxidase-like deaminating enzyme [Blastomonas natatoria]|uniref:Glycine/D-amino acid oxidase-like deaminating enzyme n=1 Tax=Blastomonas natatoria TaxID=34015 RepID=A0A2V3V7L6_9SPHN|nr:FAD-binding oxidoreductase [Blastomonas natatoria]PXW77766.1 glycine/D-amino acid oxidase-like deaminating enzyme [Blastomonas natatoria]
MAVMQYQPISSSKRRKGLTNPVWTANAAPAPQAEGLVGVHDVDVLIIGGGIAGATTALHLAERNIDVALIEAGQFGDGATGQSGGIIAPDYIRHTPETIRDVLGADAGERLTDMIGRSGAHVFDLVRRHEIECDMRQDGFYTPAHTEALAEQQRAMAQQWQARGHKVSFVEGAQTRALFGTDRYCGALRFEDGGGLNPLAFVRGVARVAQRHGARLFAGSPVRQLERKDGRWFCYTPSGTMRAQRLVLAANGGNAALHPAMRRTSLPLNVFQFASMPLDPSQRQVILPRGGAFTDKMPYLFTARLDGLGHLVSAFPMSFAVNGEKAYYREAKRRLKQYFPTMPEPQIDYLWHGLAWVNTSFLPEIYDLGDEAIAIQACNGRGLATNTVIGSQVAEMLATGDAGALSVTPRPPVPVRFHAGAALLPRLLMSLAYLTN